MKIWVRISRLRTSKQETSRLLTSIRRKERQGLKMLIENTYSLEKLYEMNDQGITFVVEDGEITGVAYGNG